MKNFTSGLPDHFILFSQTPKAQEQSRRILLRFSIVLTVPLLAVILSVRPSSVDFLSSSSLSFS